MPDEAQEAVRKIQEDRGFRRRWHSVVAEFDVDYLVRHHESFEATMSLPALSRATKELIIVAIDCCQFWPGVKVHILGALRAGATHAQVAEAILTAGIPAGPHAVAFGMEALQDVLDSLPADSELPEI